MKHEGWGLAGLRPAQRDQLARYERLLLDRAVPLGMVASSDVDHIETRHIVDSLRALPHLPSDEARICDLGSGAGLPGIPVAIASPRSNVTLAETRRLRSAFLELVADELRLPNVTVFPGRIGELSGSYDVCLARGYGDPERSWEAAEPLLREGGRLVYWAGATFTADEPPAGAVLTMGENVPLESGGPIVIMTRQ